MLWYVGKQNKIRKSADILGSHIVSAVTFNASNIHLQNLNNSLSIGIDAGTMETTCGADNITNTKTIVFKAEFSDFVAKSRVKLADSSRNETPGIKIGLDEVKLPRSVLSTLGQRPKTMVKTLYLKMSTG